MSRATEWLAKHGLTLGEGHSPNFKSELDRELTKHYKDKQTLSNYISDLVIQASKDATCKDEAEDLRKEKGVLSDENRRLRTRLAELEHPGSSTAQQRHGNDSRPARSSESEPSSSSTVPIQEHRALQRKAEELTRDLVEYKRAHAFLLTRSQNLQAQLDKWKRYRAWLEKQGLRIDDHVKADANGDPIVPTLRNNNPNQHHVRHGTGGDVVHTDFVPTAGPSSVSLEPSYPLKDLEQLDVLGASIDSGSSNPSRSDTRTRPSVDGEEARSSPILGTDSSTQEPHIGLQHAETGPLGQAKTVQLASSQTTEDEPSTARPTTLSVAPDDPDEVQFVSTRSVNHPRRRAEARVASCGNPGVKDEALFVKIKLESEGSVVEVVPVKRQMTRTTTMDLDKPGIHITTPRKRMRYSDSNIRPRSGISTAGDLTETRCSSVPVLDVPAKNDHAVGVPLALKRSNSDPPTFSLDSDCDDNPVQADSSESFTDASKVLHPISPNQQLVPRMSSSSGSRGAKSNDKRGPRAIHLVSEDGDSYVKSRRNRSRRSPSKSDERKKEGAERLHNLLEDDTPPQRRQLHALSHPSTSTLAKSTSASTRQASPKEIKRDISSSSGRRNAKHDTSARSPIIKAERTEAPRPSTRTTTPRVQPPATRKKEPLRSRPLESLSLEDFKPNPNYIAQWSDAEHVRQQDARRCLPGCTRPCCTTAFSALVDAGAQPLLPRGIEPASSPPSQHHLSRPGPSSTTPTTTEQFHLTPEDHRLLATHLGTSYSPSHVSLLPAVAQQDLLRTARTATLAAHYGRQHRRVWDRPRSPPGFWRADMPSTQEAEADRGEAARLARERVRERWEDARRGGGRWVFRDE